MFAFKSRWTIGVATIVLGLALLLDNFGVYDIDISDVVWPLLFALVLGGWGIELLFDRDDTTAKITGVILVLIALSIFGREMEWFYFDMSLLWHALWPLLLIFIGIKLLFNIKSGGKIAFMGGIEIDDKGWQLKDDSYLAVMGGVELDLTTAEIPDGTTEVNLTAIMGGIDVDVPDNVNLICKGSVLLGGIEFLGKDSGGIFATLEKEHRVDSPKTIIIQATAIMGGVEINLRRKS